MGIILANKELSIARINCDGSLQVKLSLGAAPDIVNNPADMVLILDRSGSMQGAPLENLKLGANTFIDIIDEATDGSADGQIGGGSHIGIVSFADSATQDEPLITSVAALKGAVNALQADGSTNHADAFEKAMDLFDFSSTNAKVMILFTDGRTTAGGDPNEIATLAKSRGITIYVIGLIGDDGIDEQAIDSWASAPASAHVAITPNAEDLETLFADLARNITKPGATNIVLQDIVAPCFEVTNLAVPSKGTATQVNANAVEWRIDELGVTQSETATFEFTVRRIGGCVGDVTVNEAIEYSDAENNAVTFPSPTVQVICGDSEGCPAPVSVSVTGCETAVDIDAGDLALEGLGRIVQVNVTLLHVCPNRRVALAVLLNEVDAAGNEYRRGIKTITVPAHDGPACQDVLVRCVNFVLPEDLDVSGASDGMCNVRNFNVRFIAHYIDHDFNCCGQLSAPARA